jgi:hypothetical protein
MFLTYALASGDGAPDFSDVPEPMQVQWPVLEQGPVGIFTDVTQSRPPSGDEATWVYLTHLGTLQKCLADERCLEWAGLRPTELDRVSSDLSPGDFTSSTVLVDGQPISVDAVSYRGIAFVLGHDIERHPFAMMRPASATGSWPPLRALLLDR